ncbi:MAG: DNA-directed RNA polymerase subunit omega, partial [Nitrospiria bacterium]
MEIISLPVEVDKKRIDSRFRLVILSAQRARQLMEGERPTIQERHHVRETTTAIEEVLCGDLEILYGEEAREAQREAKRLREEIRSRAILAEREGALSTELKQDLS